jgi:hypothetical protein
MIDAEYRDPTASQTRLCESVFWPRRNWAMREMLKKSEQPEWYDRAVIWIGGQLRKCWWNRKEEADAL